MGFWQKVLGTESKPETKIVTRLDSGIERFKEIRQELGFPLKDSIQDEIMVCAPEEGADIDGHYKFYGGMTVDYWDLGYAPANTRPSDNALTRWLPPELAQRLTTLEQAFRQDPKDFCRKINQATQDNGWAWDFSRANVKFYAEDNAIVIEIDKAPRFLGYIKGKCDPKYRRK